MRSKILTEQKKDIYYSATSVISKGTQDSSTDVFFDASEELSSTPAAPKRQSSCRSQLHLGLLQRILGCCLGQYDAAFLTIFINFLLAVFDVGSDFALAYYLWATGFTTEALMVVTTDYLAVFLSLLHYLMTAIQSNIPRKVFIMEMTGFVLLNPFITSLSYLLWMLLRTAMVDRYEEHLHYLAKTLGMINGTFEAPLQLILVSWFIITGRLQSPWLETDTYCDSISGNCLRLGMGVAVVSYTCSWLSLLVNLISSYQVNNILCLGAFILPNLLFRILCYVLMFSYLGYYIFVVLILVLLINLAVCYSSRKDKSGVILISSAVGFNFKC